MKRKSISFLGLFIGLLFSSLPQFVLFGFDHQNNVNDNIKIKTNGLDEQWNVYFDFFGLDMVIDLNNYIYVMTAENYYSGLGYCYYGDLIITKYNITGNQLWSLNLEGLELEYSKIAVDSKSNVYLATYYTNESITQNIVLLKLNSSGYLIWQKTLESANQGQLDDICIDSEDNIYVYSYITSSMDNVTFNLFIEKYNSSGDQLLFHVYEKIGMSSWGRDMEVDSNNNVLISGSSHWYKNQTFHKFSWLRCYNQTGDLIWNNSDSDLGSFNYLAVDSSNNVFSGQRSSVVKYDNLGNLMWIWEHDIQVYWQIYLALDSFDNIYAATIISIPEDHHNYDLYMVKINSSGGYEGYLTWGGSGDEDLMAISIDSNNNIYLLSDHFLIKNPESNGKSLTNEKLWNFYMIVFAICFSISSVSLIFIVIRRAHTREINQFKDKNS